MPISVLKLFLSHWIRKNAMPSPSHLKLSSALSVAILAQAVLSLFYLPRDSLCGYAVMATFGQPRHYCDTGFSNIYINDPAWLHGIFSNSGLNKDIEHADTRAQALSLALDS